MRVWLLHIGEELPVDGGARKFRYGYLADALADRGHKVLRWAPTFRHFGKQHRFQDDRRVRLGANYEIQFVHAPGYKRNVSFARLRTYRLLDSRLRVLARREPAPDVIVAAIPSLQWAQAAVELGRACGATVVVDVRDLWPDVFVNALPRPTRRFGRRLFAPYERMAHAACRGADALTAVSSSYLQWALAHAGRTQRSADRVVPLGFEPERVSATEQNRRLDQLAARGIDPARPICLFAGLLERSSDLETVVDAARLLAARGRDDIQFVLCGDGSKAAAIARRAAGLRNVHLLGWVEAATVQAAASIASIGLAAYAVDATQSLPNKPFEYMAGRLAVVSSLSGEMADLLAKHDCGISYQAGDAAGLAAQLGDLLADRPRLERLRDHAYAVWSKHYRSRDVYLQFVDHLAALAPIARAA